MALGLIGGYYAVFVFGFKPTIFQECEGFFVYTDGYSGEFKGDLYIKDDWYKLNSIKVGEVYFPPTDADSSVRHRFTVSKLDYVSELKRSCNNNILIRKDPLIDD